MEVDTEGLDRMDRQLLRILIEHHRGGPVGLGNLAVSLGEETSTLEDVYEPFLIKEGYIKRTPRGRQVTERALKHLGKSNFGNPELLF